MSARDLRRNAPVSVLALGAAASLFMASCSEPRSADTPAGLEADPDRLTAVQDACRTGDIASDDSRCRAAAEATRRRFRGDGVRYTPGGTASSASEPASAEPR